MDLFEVEVSERVEANLDRLISKRAARLEKEAEQQRVEGAWTQSVRRDRERRREANRFEWCAFHERMHRLHSDLAADHADRRSRLILEAGDDGPPPPLKSPPPRPVRVVGLKRVEPGERGVVADDAMHRG